MNAEFTRFGKFLATTSDQFISSLPYRPIWDHQMQPELFIGHKVSYKDHWYCDESLKPIKNLYDPLQTTRNQ